MLSNYLRFVLILLNVSPALVILWIVNFFPKLSCYFQSTEKHTNAKLTNEDFYLLEVFIICVAINWIILFLATKTLPVYSIQLKSIKSADMNFHPMFMSYFLPLAKLQFKELNDIVILVITILLFLVLAFIGKTSYHFNPILRLIFGFKHYEVQTKNEITFIMLSRKTLINTNQVNAYTQLADYVILNSTQYEHPQ